MPMIQLIRRSGEVIELQAESVNFSVTRGVAVWALPVFGVRAGLDLNQNLFSITVNGIMTDDTQPTGSASASCIIDLSRSTTNANSWFVQQQALGNSNWASIKEALHGKQIHIRSAGQESASVAGSLNEKIVLQFFSSGALGATVAETSLVPVDISGTTSTIDLASAIKIALDTGSCHVNTTPTALSTVFTTTIESGSSATSLTDQGIGLGLPNELVRITNTVKSANGNTQTQLSGAAGVSSQDFTDPFFVSNFTGGVTGSRKSKGDKIQDIIDATVNASAGGGMLSPQSFTGDLIEMPDALGKFDIATLLRISESPSVSKYIVGMRIPYESMVTATGVTEELRQFIVPSGPGKSYPSESNTEPFDPVDVVNGETIRPNPFFRQGIAIPGIVQSFEPAFQAGDSVWTYTLGFNACEQLLGI